MTSKIKALGLALIAIAAIGALALPAAQAGEFDVGVESGAFFGPLEVGQSAQLTLKKTASESQFPLKCQTATMEGATVGKKINEATATATYSGCTAFGVAAQVLMNGCKFTLTGAGQPANTAVADVAGCTSGKTIEAKTALCSLDIGEQAGLSHIVATNISAQEVTLSATIAGVKVQQTGAACPDGNLHTGTNGTLTANTIHQYQQNNGGTQVTEHGHQFLKLNQGGAKTTIQST
jgi:hypothetical protein